jgi:hypothetical protein
VDHYRRAEKREARLSDNTINKALAGLAATLISVPPAAVAADLPSTAA